MKLVLDEKIKHRLVGIAVILSIGIIFTPALFKKSQQRFEEYSNVPISMPKPIMEPQVSVPDKKQMFHAVKVVHIDVPQVPRLPTTVISHAVPMKQLPSRIASIVPDLHDLNKPISPPKPLQPFLHKPMPYTVAPQKTPATRFAHTYAVQLATFAHLNNAVALVNALNKRGYNANYHRIIAKNSVVFYRVIVGSMRAKVQAQSLQKQLAKLTSIDGFVVTLKG